jgi:LPS export ABC transporter protein LptC
MLAKQTRPVRLERRMRTRLRWLGVGLLVAVLATGAWLLKGDFDARRRAAATRTVMEVLPNVAQRIQNFHRVKIDNGRKVWEVSAREAQYLENEEVVVVDAPVLEVFFKDGRSVSLHGDGGKVFLKQHELQRVEIEGAIEVQLGEYALQTDAISYEAERGVIVAPGEVRMAGADFELRGERMEVNVADQQLALSSAVRTTLWPHT